MLRVFRNGVLRKIFGPKWDEVTVKRERTCDEELHEFRFSLNIIWVIKARKMICVGYVAPCGCCIVIPSCIVLLFCPLS